MGHHLVVTQGDHDPRLHIELLAGPLSWGLDQGLIPGCTRIVAGRRRTIRYVEYSEDADHSHDRAEWLKTEEGQRALRNALDADARGECACDELLAGPKDLAP
jgi:hypothetical protein